MFSDSLQFDREHFSEVFVDLKWFESKVGNKYLNEAAGLAAEKEAARKDTNKKEVEDAANKSKHSFYVGVPFPAISIFLLFVGCPLSGSSDLIRWSGWRRGGNGGRR